MTALPQVNELTDQKRPGSPQNDETEDQAGQTTTKNDREQIVIRTFWDSKVQMEKPQFGQIPHWIIERGLLPKLRSASEKHGVPLIDVYLVLRYAETTRSNICQIGQGKIAKFAGIRKEKVRIALDLLQQFELIEVLSCTERKRSMYRPIQIPNGAVTTCRVDFSGSQTGSRSENTGSREKLETEVKNPPDGTEKPKNEVKNAKKTGTSSMFPSGTKTTTVVDSHSDLEKRAERHTAHLLRIHPSWNRAETFVEASKLCETWDSLDIKEIIEKWGSNAESVGLIRHYLAKERRTIEQNAELKARQDREREDKRRRDAEARAQAASLEYFRETLKQKTAEIAGKPPMQTNRGRLNGRRKIKIDLIPDEVHEHLAQETKK